MDESENLRSTRDVIRQSKDRVVSDARDVVRDTAQQQKARAADGLLGVAGALHRTADNLSGESDTAARYAHMAADQLDTLARSLRDRDLDQLRADAEGFARRQPTLFIGTAMAAGFMMARFLKSSPRYTRAATASSGATTSYTGTDFAGSGFASGVEDPIQPGGSAI